MSVNRTIIAAISALLLLGLAGAAAAADQTPFNGPHTIPGLIQAEDYDNGGAGVAYSDTTSGNSGGAGRLTEAVDLETVNGITNIGWIIGGEWTDTRSRSPRPALTPQTSASVHGVPATRPS